MAPSTASSNRDDLYTLFTDDSVCSWFQSRNSFLLLVVWIERFLGFYEGVV